MAQGTSILRLAITIPGSGSNGDTIANLAALTSDQQGRLVAVKIHKYLANSATARDAFYASDSATVFTNAQYIAAGENYYEPATRDAVFTNVRAVAAGTIAAVAIFTLAATAGTV